MMEIPGDLKQATSYPQNKRQPRRWNQMSAFFSDKRLVEKHNKCLEQTEDNKGGGKNVKGQSFCLFVFSFSPLALGVQWKHKSHATSTWPNRFRAKQTAVIKLSSQPCGAA